MHELSITQSIVNIAVETAAEHKVKKVHEIRIRIGEYSGIVPQCVQQYFDILSKGTAAEGAVLKMERIPITMRCEACGAENEIDKRNIRCPACGSTQLKLLTGHEFYVESLEVD